jgi:DNA-binding CsgD family transcriptional regulator
MAWLGAAQPVAILMIIDPERGRRARKDDLRRRFGLTPAEADVALQILKGDGRQAAAARLGIAAATVRAHLSHIFEKTGVRRQAELVGLLMQGERGDDAGDCGQFRIDAFGGELVRRASSSTMPIAR